MIPINLFLCNYVSVIIKWQLGGKVTNFCYKEFRTNAKTNIFLNWALIDFTYKTAPKKGISTSHIKFILSELSYLWHLASGGLTPHPTFTVAVHSPESSNADRACNTDWPVRKWCDSRATETNTNRKTTTKPAEGFWVSHHIKSIHRSNSSKTQRI